MESYKCRFCSKSFFNGRALGGHVRSHMRVDEEEEEERASQLSYETESDVSSSSEEGKGENSKFVLLEDGESESESSRNINNLTRKRSNRTRKLEWFTTNKSQLELEPPHSSASDTTTEEDLAVCLMMLSRDKWKKNKTYKEIEIEESEGYNKSSKIKTTKGRFKCETCEKVFKSYQALGGHRASHKKNRVRNKTEQRSETEHDNVTVPEKRIHECPICFRVFSSGQALGGHKRSHGIGNLSVNRQVNRIQVVEQRMIDLNLPAPTEEDDVSVVFQ